MCELRTYTVTRLTTLRAGQSAASEFQRWLRQGAVVQGRRYGRWVEVCEINGYEAWGYVQVDKLKEIAGDDF